MNDKRPHSLSVVHSNFDTEAKLPQDDRYIGLRFSTELGEVRVRGKALDPRFDLRIHSQRGFDWGHGNAGAAQLALALIADCLKDDAEALRMYNVLKWKIVAKLPYPGWTLNREDIYEAICL